MKILNFVAIGTIAVSFSLSAEEVKTSTFSTMDKDGDGYISITEATGNEQLVRDWAKYDLDSDGKIELNEFSAFEGSTKAFIPPDNDMEPGTAPH